MMNCFTKEGEKADILYFLDESKTGEELACVDKCNKNFHQRPIKRKKTIPENKAVILPPLTDFGKT